MIHGGRALLHSADAAVSRRCGDARRPRARRFRVPRARVRRPAAARDATSSWRATARWWRPACRPGPRWRACSRARRGGGARAQIVSAVTGSFDPRACGRPALRSFVASTASCASSSTGSTPTGSCTCAAAVTRAPEFDVRVVAYEKQIAVVGFRPRSTACGPRSWPRRRAGERVRSPWPRDVFAGGRLQQRPAGG